MKRWLRSLASAALALAFCVLAIRLADLLGIGTSLPAPRGEDDFGLRASVFLLLVCPSFFALGFWSARRGAPQWRAIALRWLGMFIGTLISFVALAGLTHIAVADSARANAIALGFLLGWITLAVIGAIAVERLATRG